MRRVAIWPVTVLLATVFSGCGGDDTKPMADLVPVSGTVSFDGKPLEQGRIMFAPDDVTIGQPASGVITNGEFTVITTVSAPGVVAGKYKVRIEAFEGDGATEMPAPSGTPESMLLNQRTSLIPMKYGDVKSSGLEVEVESGMDPLKFDLEP